MSTAGAPDGSQRPPPALPRAGLTTPGFEEALGRPPPGEPPSESFVDQPYSAELYSYLRGTPKEHGYLLTPATRKGILRRVSWYLLSKDDRLADLVPLDEGTGGALREALEDEIDAPIEYTEVRRGQPCGHVFKRGEGVYRCKSCSMDDTCVLCTRCFQATDHEGHDTSFSMNSGTGGCCDCGDPEAWKIPLRCRHHSTFDELDEMGIEPIISSPGVPFVPGYNNSECPVSVRRSIELTIAVVLEFILETFATSPAALSSQFDEASIMDDAKNAGLTINDYEPQEQYAVVLWNDEVHSYQDVIDQCTEALQCSHAEAKKIAETVDTCGREVLRVSTSIIDLIDIATTMTNVSLSVSIRAARDTFREQLAASLLTWLRDLACCKFRPLARVFQGKINNEVRSAISCQLCLRWVAPYRNAYLADILEKLYDYNLPESEYDDDDDDDDEEEGDDDYEDGEDMYDDGDGDGDGESHSAMQEDDQEYYASLVGGDGGKPAATTAVVGSAAGPADDLCGEGVHGSARGRRRRRSESEDSLLQQGQERASPRVFVPLPTEEHNAAIPPSLWLAESSRRADGESGASSAIHAAMSAAADAVGAARTSLARIAQLSATASCPPHSPAPGAYPHSAEPATDEPDTRAQAAQAVPAPAPDPDVAEDMETARHVNRVLRGCGQQRLDWLLIFDLQLWKEVRSGLRELYMATLMLDVRYKSKIALTFARNYPRLSRAFLTQDRAPEHSVLLFSVQLFTTLTLSATLVERHQFMYIILDVLKKFFMQPTPDILRHYGVILCDTESFRNRRYFHVFHDMRYLASTPQVRGWVTSRHRFLAAYLSFIGLFQGMNPTCRAIVEHVEFEADTWVNAFNVTLQVAKSCRQFAECYGISARGLFFAMRGTLRTIYNSTTLMAEENGGLIVRNAQMHGYLPHNIGVSANAPGEAGEYTQLAHEMHVLSTRWNMSYEVVKYDVSAHPVSFHHPLHWFMAELFQHIRHLSDSRARDYGFASVQDLVFSAFDTRLDRALDPNAPATGSGPQPRLHAMSASDRLSAQRKLLHILDHPVRVCVIMAQIRAGLWVRNGFIIRLQAHHYREVSLRENTYDQDIVMIQFFLSIWPDPDHILMTLLDRFGLLDWFSGRPHTSQIYDATHMQYMVEEFLNLLIVIVSERYVATGKSALDMARREIVHGCLSAISYSDLSKKIPERLAEIIEFENLLQKIADYRGPVGIMDFGQYELKDEFLDEVDPYFIHFSRSQREEIEEVLRERLRKRALKSGGAAGDVLDYIPPRLEPICSGPFQRLGLTLHTPLACQMLFFSLLHATQTSAELLSETIVDEALQLIVLALEDGLHGAVARELGGPDTSDGSQGQGQDVNRGGLWRYALEQGYTDGRGTPMNLLGLVLTLGLKPEMRQWKHKLDHIYTLFRKGGPRIVRCIDDYYANLRATPVGNEVLRSAMNDATATERRKQAAKARQAAIMADFASQQQNFISQYGDAFDDVSDEDEPSRADQLDAAAAPGAADRGKGAAVGREHRPLWSMPSGPCMVCQEECDGIKPYGVLTLVQANRATRAAPLTDAAQVVDILRLPGGLDVSVADIDEASPRSSGSATNTLLIKGANLVRSTDQLRVMDQIAAGAYGAASGLSGFPVLYHERGMAASTCGHLMHMRCFVQYCQGVESQRMQMPTRNHPENLHRKEYLCPMCKSLGNVLLPVLPSVRDYDLLAVAERNPDRFSSPAATAPAEHAAAFERWLLDDWRPFGEVLAQVTDDRSAGSRSGRSSASSAKTSAVSAGSDSATNASESMAGEASSERGDDGGHKPAAGNREADGAASDPTAAPGAGAFPFSLAESIPRLEDLVRGASRLPSGLGLQTLLSRILPHLAGNTAGAAPGAERLAMPLSRYTRWLTERQLSDAAHHHHQRRQAQALPGVGMGVDGDNCPAPDYGHRTASGAQTPEQPHADLEARFRENMEAFQYMYTRLYEVLQNVQRDNHVGLPAPSLVAHLSRGKGPAGDDVPHRHAHRGHVGAAPGEAPEGGESNDEDDEDEDDEDDDGDGYLRRAAPAVAAAAAAAPGTHPLESQAGALMPFLQNILDHIGVLGPAGGPQHAAAPLAGSVAGQLLGAKPQPYPFDMAANALFAHSLAVLELTQRGVRNPPVFSHEDSRTLPSGTLTDGVPDSQSAFMYLLAKVSELHYRSVLRPVAEIGRPSLGESDPQTSAQRLHALIAESRLQLAATSATASAPSLHALAGAAPHGDVLAHARLGMLGDIGCSLAPLFGSDHTCTREFTRRQSRWLTGSDDVAGRPLLMQSVSDVFSGLSLSLVGPLGLDIWHLMRLFLTAELVRVCVAVGDSLLGEYTGAPRALRIAQSLPCVAEGAGPGLSSPSPPSAAGARRAAKHVPRPWVDAPEARDVNLLSVLTSGRDATLLESAAPGIHMLVVWVIRQLQGPNADPAALERLQSAAHPVTVTKLVATLLLPFMRRLALQLNLQFGLDIASEAPWLQAERCQALGGGGGSGTQVLSQSEPECARLLKLLNLPGLDQIFNPASQPATLSLVEDWLRDLRAFRRRHTSPISLGAGYTMAVPVAMPTLFSLVELPDRFDVFFEHSAKACCPRCNGVPNDPALCLLCGGFICAQSFCCEEDGVGECNMHMKTCGGTVGLYLLVKKCGLLLLHHDNGCFMSAPYLDQHGEVDLGLRRGRPLYLNKSRYEELRRLVLAQKIPVFVARKVEQTFDLGGWISL
ncbi:E3 ubiquitin-protein ligase ubr1 [Coemansia biformis]|uniref:E3 ubiquitin-protein ligase n=1 Tax=Coemansia biformis TaxID=1286918 RepID=A0A9W7YG99_9FUNG|nr:E3 ubiquitin-protein ligase ubr1 [Coemansia biformis]